MKIYLSLLFGAVFFVAGCDRTPVAGPAHKKAVETKSSSTSKLSLQMAQLPISYSTITHLAQSQGFCQETQLDCIAVSVPAGPDVVTALRSDAVDSATVGTIAITPVATMVAAGLEPVVVATILVSDKQAKLVCFASSGINADPVSLRGKKIGVTRNTNGDIYLSRLLKKGGLTERDVTLVSARPAELKASLLRGDLDSAILWDPFIVQTKREYENLVRSGKHADEGATHAFVDPTLHTLAFNIVTTKKKLANNREAIQRLLKALISADTFLKSNPALAQAEIEKWLNLEPGDLGDFFNGSDFHVHFDLARCRTWLREELEWLQSRDPSIQIPDKLDDFFDGSLLEAIDPTRVRLN